MADLRKEIEKRRTFAIIDVYKRQGFMPVWVQTLIESLILAQDERWRRA